MFNPIVKINLFQVKGILRIIFIQHSRNLVRHKVAKRRGKIVRRPYGVGHFFERDILAVVREDTCDIQSGQPYTPNT